MLRQTWPSLGLLFPLSDVEPSSLDPHGPVVLDSDLSNLFVIMSASTISDSQLFIKLEQIETCLVLLFVNLVAVFPNQIHEFLLLLIVMVTPVSVPVKQHHYLFLFVLS